MLWFSKNNSSEAKNWFGAIYMRPLFGAFLGMVSSTIILQFLMRGHDDLPQSTMLLISLLPLHVIATGIFVYKLSPAILQLGANMVLQWKNSAPHPWRALVILFIRVVLYSMCVNAIISIICFLLDVQVNVQEIVGNLMTSHNPLFIVLSGIAAILLAPIAEELLFRLGLYNVLTTRLSPTAASLVTSLLFAAAHGQLSSIPGLFVIGLCLQYAKNHFGLRQSMLLHACFNAFQFSMILLLA